MKGNMRLAGTILLLLPGLMQADSGDPPSRVARLNYTTGAVSFRPAGVEDWTAAALNYPVTTGDNLWVDRGARAELHVGSTAIRLSSETSFGLLNLDDRMAQISVSQGTVQIRVRYLPEDQGFEVDTPNVAISLLRPGEYRIDANPDNQTTVVTVRSGQAELTASGGPAFPLRPGQVARLTGTNPPTQDLLGLGPPDSWDRWCENRDLREEQSVSARYVSREMIGYEDLDTYGQWRDDPRYGAVWIPASVPGGWAPYRYGHWAWVEPWGWTWIDDAPWGFAPFHYGRWVTVGGGWAWIPGRPAPRPVYAPALVAFVGGSHFGLSLSVGGGPHVAWFPLGPGEAYVPAYHVSPAYVRNVNVTHVTNINVTNVYNNTTVVNRVTYVNQRVPGAVTAVPQQAFVGARPIGRAAVVVSPQQMASAQVVGTTPGVVPRRESVLASAQGLRPMAAPPASATRPVVTRTAPPPPSVPFAARQQALAANPGRPVDAATLNRLQASQPAHNPMVVQTAPVQRTPNLAPRVTPETSRPSQQVVRPTPQTARPVPQTAPPAPTPIHPAPQANPPKPQMSHPAPQTMRESPQAVHPQGARPQAAPARTPGEQRQQREERGKERRSEEREKPRRPVE